MAILEMEKIRLLVHRSFASDVLESVQKSGAVEFSEIEDNDLIFKREKEVFEFNYVSSRLDFAVHFLSKIEKRNFLRNLFEGSRVRTSEKEIKDLLNNFHYNDIIEKIQNIEEETNDLKNKIKSLEDEEKILQEWRGLNVSLANFETKKTNTILLKGKKEDIQKLQEELSQNFIIGVEEISEKNHVLTFFKKDEEELNKVLSKFEIDSVSLPKRRGTPEEELERISRAKNHSEDRLLELDKEAHAMVKFLPDLKKISDHMFWHKSRHDILSEAYGTNDVLVFEGWCPKKKLGNLKSEVEKITDLAEIETIKLKEGEEPPVEIENHKFLKPFETITRLYGMPSYKDLDPTLFLSGFFFIFFGLCLTDVGYGIFIFLLTLLILSFYKVPKDSQPLIKLMMLGGLSSIIIGLFFGGYLGIDINAMPEFLRNLQHLDPVSSPLPVFYLSLAFGVIQVIVGLVLKILRDAKNGALKDGLLDQVPWLMFFASIILFIGNKFGFLGQESSIYIYLIIISALAIVLTQGRKEKGIIKKGFSGIISLYGSVGYFSDVLSYSRLLALGLATSALAFAVNLIAVLVRDMIPVVGVVLMVIILIMGHIFNMAVNILGAFIHSARLQFVEFFGKFITGTGRSFKAFKQEERNVILEQDRLMS